MTTSIGGCWMPTVVDPGAPGLIVDVADSELYRAKGDGRDRVYIAERI